MMNFARSFGWINTSVCKKQCRSLFWRIRAAVRKSVKSSHHKSRKQVTFRYDPTSYALNFDDGSGSSNTYIGGGLRSSGGEKIIGEEIGIGYYYKLQFFFLLAANSTLVYVFLIRLKN